MWSFKAPLLRKSAALPLCCNTQYAAVAGVCGSASSSQRPGRAPPSKELRSQPFSALSRGKHWAALNGTVLHVTGRRGLRSHGAGVFGVSAAYSADATPVSPAGTVPRTGLRVCILGGGFGGLYTAVRLDQLLWPHGMKPQVTLIDQNERFVFKPLLYDFVAGTATAWEVAPFFQQLLAPYNIKFLQGRVNMVMPESPQAEVPGSIGGNSGGGGVVTLANGSVVEYDWLVVALGAETTTFGIPGARELAVPFCTYADALQAKERLQDLQRRPSGLSEVVVVGGGYAGIELATTAAEMLAGRGRVKLVSSGDDILEGSPAGQRAAARSVLTGKAVSIITSGTVSSIKRVGPVAAGTGPDTSPRMVYIKQPDGSQQLLQADLVLWTAGSQPASKSSTNSKCSSGMLSLPFPLNSKGATETDETLRVVSHPRVFALGDVSGMQLPNSDPLPITAQVAFQQADYVAWNLWAAINNRPLLPFRYQHLGEMMSLGAVNGALTLPVPLPPPLATLMQDGVVGNLLGAAGFKVDSADDRRRITVDGPLAGALRRVAYWYRQPTGEQRLRVGVSWLEQLAQDGSKAVQGALSGRPPSSWRD